MNIKFWKTGVAALVAAIALAISADYSAAQSVKDAQKAAEKAQEEATKAADDAKDAQEKADNAPKSDADKNAENADKQAEKDEQAARDAQDKADASQAAKDAGEPNSAKPAADDKKDADNARDRAQKSEDAAKKADEKADKGENKDNPQKINRQKQKEKRKKAQEAWEKQRKLKQLKAVTLGPTAPSGTSLAMLASTGQVKIDSAGTGETIGHIADLMLQNLTDQPLNVSIQPMILESGSGKNQHYACPKGKTVALKPHGSATVPMDGVCVNRSKPPVGKGVTGDLVINEGNPTIPQSENSHLPPKDANKLLRLCTSKYDAADKLQKDGELKNLPYHDPQKQKDIVTQWSTWMDPQICQLLGTPPATKEDLRKVVYKQVPEPMTPQTKKKIDKGIDTIFEKVELTTAKAKDLEKPNPFEQVELTGEEGKAETPNRPETIGMPTPTSTPPASGTQQTETGTQEKVEKPAEPTVSKPLEKPCPNGRLLVRHAYSECGPDGFWHVVEDAYYNCPPVKAFRVLDLKTEQKCTAGQAPPANLVGPAYKEFQGGSTDCQSPKPTDEFIHVSECDGGVWLTKTYRVYECLDGSKRIKSPPESLVRSTTDCGKPPPAPPH